MRRFGMGLVVAAGLVTALAGGGCANGPSRGECSENFEYGCNVIAAVLVTDTQAEEPATGLSVVYGGFDRESGCDGEDASTRCPTGFTCEKHTYSPWLTIASCVDGEGRMPGGRTVPTSGYELQVLAATELGGVDQFGCSCYPSGTCAPGREFSPEPFNCSSCESGLCATTSPNLIPSVVVPVPGLATIRCGSFSYTTSIADGGYDLSGDAFFSIPDGFRFGPGLAFRPQVTLPADSDCTFSLSDKISGIGGSPLQAPIRPIAFHTAR